jgi:CTP:molybdopterin cytidylyltransferase MocA
MRSIAAIVLAAGGSSRLGRPKMRLDLGGRTLLARAVAPHLEAPLDTVVVVLGEDAAGVLAAARLPDDPRVRIAVNEGWREGMASSIRRGLFAAHDADAVLIALADQPDLDAARVRAVVEAWDGRAPLVVPLADGRPAHPVLFARSLYGELGRLTGDVGARSVVEAHRPFAICLSLPALLDVDTEDDYRAARARYGGATST